jgi:two-component system CheB/CheR fusion protein
VREEVQTTREEMQTSQEELKSTNEELQSANEELQSTNEELTTSKEEMQSLNEELQTVNHELQSKVDELSRSNNDMKNLLNSTDIATLFLDGELRVRRFTTPTAKIIKLIPGDAGRLVTDITSDLDYPELAEDAREVLRTLIFKERQGATRDGRWFLVRIMPYRTLENVIDGVVITFTDASASRALQESLREQASQLKQMAESLPALVWNCKPDGSCDYVSRRWVEYTGVEDGELTGFGWLDLVHMDDRDRVRDAWKASVRAGSDFNSEFRIRSANGSHRWFHSRAVAIRDVQGRIHQWYGTNADVDDLKRTTHGGQRDGRLASLVENIAEGYLALDSQMSVIALNPAAERILQSSTDAVMGKNLLDTLQEPRSGAFQKNITDAFLSEKPLAFEYALTKPHGRFRFRVFPQRDPEGVAILFDAVRASDSASQS